MTQITFGRQTTGDLMAGADREWLVTDGLGGFAMGTVAGLRTRRYHGLLVVATEAPIGRRIGLAAIDPVMVLGTRRFELATHEWASGAVAPEGHRHLDRFDLIDGVPRWQWSVAGATLRMELAMERGRPAVVTRWTLVSAAGPVDLELTPLCTWRDVHGERVAAADPDVVPTADGFEFERAYRVRGPGFRPDPSWYRGVNHREERARGLNAIEDLHRPGRFFATLAPGDAVEVSAWASALAQPPGPAADVIDRARMRAAALARNAGVTSEAEALLVQAADQFVVTGRSGATVVAGYPWFGDWSRDTMTSYEGLFLSTARFDEGRAVLLAAAESVSEGMLANTADAGGTEYNTVDAAMWFLRAVGRHMAVSGDTDLGARLLPTIGSIVDHHLSGTRFGIRVDADGLVTQGEPGWALTWMDARIDGAPVTRRAGKPIEVNALWIDGLRSASMIAAASGSDTHAYDSLAARAWNSFRSRYRTDGSGWRDVADGCDPLDSAVRPNQVVAAAVLGGLTDAADRRSVLGAVSPLVTSVGLRSLAPNHPDYRGRHRGGPAERDGAYHQGTVWPWLLGSYVDLLVADDAQDEAHRVVEGALTHLPEWGVGSVSETADGDAPHVATGCPFQAWSVAEWLRASRRC